MEGQDVPGPDIALQRLELGPDAAIEEDGVAGPPAVRRLDHGPAVLLVGVHDIADNFRRDPWLIPEEHDGGPHMRTQRAEPGAERGRLSLNVLGVHYDARLFRQAKRGRNFVGLMAQDHDHFLQAGVTRRVDGMLE